MTFASRCGVAILLMTSLAGVTPFSKYGRTCRDIGCPSSEVCVMEEDPCTIYQRDQCGRYPTCKRRADAGSGQSCTTMICPSGQYCKTENGRPTCVNTVPGLGYDSAGVSTVNGQPSQTNVHHDTPSVSSNSNPSYPQNNNPYANANAPALPINPDRNYPVNSRTNLGYPPDPSNNYGTNSGSSGSLPYPSSGGTNLGYPPYPSVNRMPVPGHTNYPQSNYPPQSYPNSPQQNPAGYPAAGGYPQQGNYPYQTNYPQQYPGYQNYPSTYQNRGHVTYNSNPRYRKNEATSTALPTILILLISLATFIRNFS